MWAPFKDRFPIAVLSGNDEAASVRYAILLGADDFIVKPCAVTELMRRIGDLVFVADGVRMRPLVAILTFPDPSLSALAASAGFDAKGNDVYRLKEGEGTFAIALRGNKPPSQLARAPWPELMLSVSVFRKGAVGWCKVWPRSALGQDFGRTSQAS